MARAPWYKLVARMPDGSEALTHRMNLKLAKSAAGFMVGDGAQYVKVFRVAFKEPTNRTTQRLVGTMKKWGMK